MGPNECKYCGCDKFNADSVTMTRFRCGSTYWPPVAQANQAEQALEILRGNSPESPDSSPVTADQLAVSDYYEAVRQQVPWMVTIEHIEGLVEGYRRCGVMVWRAAEQIKLIFGGGNEQAE